MAIKFIEQWKFKLQGRAVPVVKCEDVDKDGRVYTLHFLGKVKDRANSLQETWNGKVWEKDPNFSRITMIDEKGIETYPYVVSKSGKTCGLYTEPSKYPNREDVLGRWSMMDDITEAMDLNKSMKQLAIGLVIGLGIGAFILGPMLTTMLS
jgi:hypothetical protein